MDGRLKAGHDGRVRLPKDEAFLVGADGGADHFGRQVEEGRLEFAHEDNRPFDEARDFLEQRLVLDQRQPLREGEVLGVGENDRLTPVGVEHDLGLVQRLDIIVEAAHMDRRRRHEAMAPGHIAGLEPMRVEIEVDNLRRVVRRSERADDAAQRPHPAKRIFAGIHRANNSGVHSGFPDSAQAA